MSHWNYRIVRYADGGYGLHEVYYDLEGEPETPTSEPIRFMADDEEGVDGIVKSLKLALKDAETRPVLQMADTWAELQKDVHGDREAIDRELAAWRQLQPKIDRLGDLVGAAEGEEPLSRAIWEIERWRRAAAIDEAQARGQEFDRS